MDREQFKKICDKAESWPNEPAMGIIELDREERTATKIATDKELFCCKNDPTALLDAIVTSFDFNFSMPRWAHKSLADIAADVIKSKGNNSFDILLGLKRSRGRSGGPFEKLERKTLEKTIVSMVVFLNKVVGFNLSVCYQILSVTPIKYGVTNDLKVAELEPTTIGDIYRRSKSCKDKAQFLNNDLFKFHPLHYFFEKDFKESFFALCDSGEISGPEYKKAMNSYHKFISESKKKEGFK